MKLNYQLLDVFTHRPLSGNPLAVVLRADNLLDDQMQAIAREFGLSETVFLRRPQIERHTASLRIFTPEHELPFAGHPTIGAATVLGLQNRASAVRLEEQVGLVTCLVDIIDKRMAHARFTLPRLPEEAGRAPSRAVLALALGLEADEIGCADYAPAVYSAGNPFYLVPVRDAAVLARLDPSRVGWMEAFPLGNHCVYCFTPVADEHGIDFAARMISPEREDPGTGSAAAALIGLVARDGGVADGQVEFHIRQGEEIGRRCCIAIQLRKEAGRLTHADVGGHAVIIGEGTLDFGD